MLKHVALVILASAIWMIPEPAQACSPSRECRTVYGLSPADAATDVPRNVELRVSYRELYKSWTDTLHPVLEREDGTEVPTRWQTSASFSFGSVRTASWIGSLDTPLAPSTRYRLRHPYSACGGPDAGAGYCGLCPSESAGDVIAEFTTGSTTLDQAPAAPVVGELGVARLADLTTNCGPPTAPTCSQPLPVAGITGDLLLRVQRGNAWVGDYYPSSNGVSFGWRSPGAYSGPDVLADGELQLYAVDVAGNRSAPVNITVPACSTATLPDAGAFTSDAGTTHPDVESNNDGCSLVTSRASPLWAALALLALLHRRRPRTSASAPYQPAQQGGSETAVRK